MPKLCGADIELGNFVLGAAGHSTPAPWRRARCWPRSTACRAARAVSYTPYTGNWSSYSCGRSKREDRDDRDAHVSGAWNPQDWGRKYLPTNGGCVYIDLDHLELCLPETLSAWDHAAAWHAMLRIARRAMDSANARLPEGRSIQVLVNNSDGHGHSYGSHLNFLVTRRSLGQHLRRKPHYLGWLASFQVSSIVYTGPGESGIGERRAGGSLPDLPARGFLRDAGGHADHLRSPHRQFARGASVRAPALVAATRPRRRGCTSSSSITRWRISPACSRSGVMQLALAMMEGERVSPALVLDDPLTALGVYSRDPTLLQPRAPGRPAAT